MHSVSRNEPIPGRYPLRHDMPIPVRGNGRAGRASGPAKTLAPYLEPSRRTMIEMNVGDCFIVPAGTVPGKSIADLHAIISHQAGYILGRENFVTLLTHDGICLWRVG